MEIKRKRITSGILALLAATVLGCGTIQGASGKSESGSGAGENYLTADEAYGTGAQNTTNSGIGGAPAADGFAPSFQP